LLAPSPSRPQLRGHAIRASARPKMVRIWHCCRCTICRRRRHWSPPQTSQQRDAAACFSRALGRAITAAPIVPVRQGVPSTVVPRWRTPHGSPCGAQMENSPETVSCRRRSLRPRSQWSPRPRSPCQCPRRQWSPRPRSHWSPPQTSPQRLAAGGGIMLQPMTRHATIAAIVSRRPLRQIATEGSRAPSGAQTGLHRAHRRALLRSLAAAGGGTASTRLTGLARTAEIASSRLPSRSVMEDSRAPCGAQMENSDQCWSKFVIDCCSIVAHGYDS